MAPSCVRWRLRAPAEWTYGGNRMRRLGMSAVGLSSSASEISERISKVSIHLPEGQCTGGRLRYSPTWAWRVAVW